MRQGPHQKRSRGRGNGGRKPHSSPRNHTYDSNGPDVRIRGTAYQVHEKYMALARDASAAGDRIRAENLLQHAEHYLRIIQAEEAAQAEYEEGQQRHNGNRNQGGERNYEPRGDRFRDDRQASDSVDDESDGQVVMLSRHSQDEGQGDIRGEGESDSRSADNRSAGRQGERRQSQGGERRQRSSRDEGRDDFRDEDDADGLQRMMGVGGGSQWNGQGTNGPGANGPGANGQGDDAGGDEGMAPRRGPLRRPRRSRSADAETPETAAAPETGENAEQTAAPVRRRRAPRSRSTDADQETLPVEEESGAA